MKEKHLYLIGIITFVISAITIFFPYSYFDKSKYVSSKWFIQNINAPISAKEEEWFKEASKDHIIVDCEAENIEKCNYSFKVAAEYSSKHVRSNNKNSDIFFPQDIDIKKFDPKLASFTYFDSNRMYYQNIIGFVTYFDLFTIGPFRIPENPDSVRELYYIHYIKNGKLRIREIYRPYKSGMKYNVSEQTRRNIIVNNIRKNIIGD